MTGGEVLVRPTAKTSRNLAATILSLLCAGLFALSLGGCAEWSYTETTATPESRYDTYYGPDYYPYYPYHSYCGGAYYNGD